MREDGQRTCFTLGKTPGAERVLLWDDLEGLFKWGVLSGWGVPRRSKSASAAFDGSWGLQLSIRRTVPDGTLLVGAARSIPLVRDGTLRLECVAMTPAAGGWDGFGIAIEWYDGERKYGAGIWYETALDYFIWGSRFCTWYDSGLAKLPRAAGAWHRIWLEIDLVKKEWKRVGIDADTVQLDGNKICAVADAGPVMAHVICFAVVTFTGSKSVYFDDVFCGLV